MTIGEKIKEYRIICGLTQKELGKRLGVTQATVGQYETNTNPPKIETLEKIAKALKIPVVVLLCEPESQDDINRKIMRDAIKHYGVNMQLTVCMEELSELIKELSKHLRGYDNNAAVAEEIADVEIMLAQLKIIFNNDTAVSNYRAEKLARLAKRMIDEGKGYTADEHNASSTGGAKPVKEQHNETR